MKFNINDEVVDLASGKKAIIIATKEVPYKPKHDMFMRKEIYPEANNDYIIMYKINENEYLGTNNAYEHQLDLLDD